MATGFTDTKPETDSYIPAFMRERCDELMGLFGCPFQVVDITDVPSTVPPQYSQMFLTDSTEADSPRCCSYDLGHYFLHVPLSKRGSYQFVAYALFRDPEADEFDLDQELVESLGLPSSGHIPVCQRDMALRFAQNIITQQADRVERNELVDSVKQLSVQVSRDTEETNLLYELIREARISCGLREVQHLAMSMLAKLIPFAQVMHVDPNGGLSISYGSRLLTDTSVHEILKQIGADNLESTYVNHSLSDLDWAKDCSALRGLAVVPILEAGSLLGWLVAASGSDQNPVGAAECRSIEAVAAILATHQTNTLLFHDFEELFLAVVHALSSSIDAKDPYTCGHSQRVGLVATRLGQEIGLPERDNNLLYLAGLLHDVGKIGVPDAILRKAGQLTNPEYEEIKKHTLIGFDILSGVRHLVEILPGVRNHHESYDGTGYPDKLQEEEIPLIARILAVADAYDAMVSDRPYRRGLDKHRVCTILRSGANKQWDGAIVQALMSSLQDIDSMIYEVETPDIPSLLGAGFPTGVLSISGIVKNRRNQPPSLLS